MRREVQMTAQTSVLGVRVNADVKAKAVKVLGDVGLSCSDAVRIFFHRIVADQAFPLELKVPQPAEDERAR